MDPIDLDRLERVRRWGAVPPPERTEEWIREFEAAFWPAPLALLPDPVEVEGHSYRLISFPGSGLATSFARPAMLVDQLIERGQGLIAGEAGHMSMATFKMGEIVSYRLYGRAFDRPSPSNLVKPRLDVGEVLQLAPLNEGNFPNWVRVNVRRYLQKVLGIAAPRAYWVCLPDGQEGVAFELSPVTDDSEVRRIFDEIRWFLPARIVAFHIKQLENAEPMAPI